MSRCPTFNIAKANGHSFADAQTTYPHEQDQGTITPGGKHLEECLKIRFSNDIRHSLWLFSIQTLTPTLSRSNSLKRVDWVGRKDFGVYEVQFSEKGRYCGQATIDGEVRHALTILTFHEGEAVLAINPLNRQIQRVKEHF